MGALILPTKPPANGCANNICHISDANIRFELESIDPYQSNAALKNATGNTINSHRPYFYGFDEDTVFNVFFAYLPDTTIKFDGIFDGSSEKSRFVLGTNFPPHIIMRNGFVNALNAGFTAQILIHEFGHAFGIWHTAEENYCNSQSSDRLTDIFGGYGSNGIPCPVPKHINGHPFNPADFHNDYMMDYPAGNKYFSPMQIGMGHRIMHIGDLSQFCYPDVPIGTADWIVDADQLWDFELRMFQNIIIRNNSTLTIKCLLQMPPGGKIIVEQGAKLVLDGGTITSYHPKASWAGVELFGDKYASPVPANQGRFEMKNDATVEYAMTGVRDFQHNVWNGGGIINVSNSTFKDCWKAVELNDYPHFARGSSCSFNNVTFITENADAVTNSNFNGVGQFTSFNEKGVLVNNCTFENRIALGDIHNIHQGNYAIYSCDAGFRVQNCNFKGYRAGVTTTTVYNHPGRTAKVMSSSFDSLSTGIVFANNFSYAQDNVFDKLIGHVYNSGMMAYYREGEAVYIDNASGITLTRNTVNNTNSYPQRGFTSNDSRVYGTRMIDNTLNDTRLGVITQRRNPTLDILCNHFSDGFGNIVVNPQSNHAFFTLKDQGNGCGPTLNYRAGNTFSGSPAFHVASYLSNNWNYFYMGVYPNHIPTNISGASLVDVNCTGEEGNSQCDLPGNVESWADELFDEAYVNWGLQEVSHQESTTGLMQLATIVAQLNERGSTDSLISRPSKMAAMHTGLVI